MEVIVQGKGVIAKGSPGHDITGVKWRGMLQGFLKVPSKMLSLLSSLLQLTELRSWVKTKVLNMRVVMNRFPWSEWSKPRMLWPQFFHVYVFHVIIYNYSSISMLIPEPGHMAERQRTPAILHIDRLGRRVLCFWGNLGADYFRESVQQINCLTQSSAQAYSWVASLCQVWVCWRFTG